MRGHFATLIEIGMHLITCNPAHIPKTIGHLHDGVILQPRPECFVKMLSHSNFSTLLGIKRQLEI